MNALIKEAFRFSSSSAGYSRAAAAYLRSRCDLEVVSDDSVSFVFDSLNRYAIVRLPFDGGRPEEYR